MENKHDDLLKNAIEKLPNYATMLSWEEIAQQLEDKKLEEAISQLPTYVSPIEWEKPLLNPFLKKKLFSSTFFLSVFEKQTIMRVSASLVLLASVLGIIKMNTEEVNYSEEVIAEKTILESKVNNDFRLIVQNLPESNKSLKKVKHIQTEFKQLSGDQEQLENAISLYETNTDLIQEWVKIENEKANLLNELALYI